MISALQDFVWVAKAPAAAATSPLVTRDTEEGAWTNFKQKQP
jgi:hypothetical protein